MIVIREAQRDDYSTIVRFQMEMAMETEGILLQEPIVELGVKAVMNDNTKGLYYVAESGNKPVGSLLTTYEWSDWRNGQILWIQSVYVEKEYRRMGVFKKMYEHIKAKTLDERNNYRGIRLYVDKSNVAAIRVYEKLGMSNHHYETFEWMKS
ncbi:MAG: GNAT family N-acetyltransferase [Cyclobacteriaceae bacterium]|nr:GNAT family N-acetyltransferase [Cyclobacteriaceae bacterium]